MGVHAPGDCHSLFKKSKRDNEDALVPHGISPRQKNEANVSAKIVWTAVPPEDFRTERKSQKRKGKSFLIRERRTRSRGDGGSRCPPRRLDELEGYLKYMRATSNNGDLGSPGDVADEV